MSSLYHIVMTLFPWKYLAYKSSLIISSPTCFRLQEWTVTHCCSIDAPKMKVRAPDWPVCFLLTALRSAFPLIVDFARAEWMGVVTPLLWGRGSCRLLLNDRLCAAGEHGQTHWHSRSIVSDLYSDVMYTRHSEHDVKLTYCMGAWCNARHGMAWQARPLGAWTLRVWTEMH